MSADTRFGQYEPDRSHIVVRRPDFKDNFRATGIAVDGVLPRNVSGGRAPNRPREIRALGRLVEFDILRRERVHTLVIDRVQRTIAYCGERTITDEVEGMVSEKCERLKPRPLRKFDDVIAEIAASLQKAPSHFPSK